MGELYDDGLIDFPLQVTLGKGLEGAITNKSKIGYVDGQRGKLVYRGYDIEDLAEHSTFEEVVYLLLFGKLPTREELDSFSSELISYRDVPDELVDVMRKLPRDAHPMSILEVAVSTLGTLESYTVNTSNNAELLRVSTIVGKKLISKLATLTAYLGRIRKNQQIIPPRKDLSHAANFLYMLTGSEPDSLVCKLMDMALIMHADHGMNASTFTSMVVASTLSDMYSAITAGICALKGPLHGGANEYSLGNLLKLNSEEDARQWVRECIKKKVKIMGFGHRIYKVYDPRAKVFKRYAAEICKRAGMERLYSIAEAVEDEVVKAYGSKGIYPNVDFYSGLIYHAMGIDIALFTPIFAVSRVAGWVARILEYLPENRIFRPRALYVGPTDLKYVPIEERNS